MDKTKPRKVHARTEPLRVYLAGNMELPWRAPIKKRLQEAGAVVWEPADNPQQSAALYVPLDLKMAKEADAILAYVPKGHTARGTHAEMGVAFAEGHPIWLVWQDLPWVYSFSAVMAYKVYTELEPAVEDLLKFVKRRVLD